MRFTAPSAFLCQKPGRPFLGHTDRRHNLPLFLTHLMAIQCLLLQLIYNGLYAYQLLLKQHLKQQFVCIMIKMQRSQPL